MFWFIFIQLRTLHFIFDTIYSRLAYLTYLNKESPLCNRYFPIKKNNPVSKIVLK
nr:MAG TPA: hypothetical protein [Bacteriophage sp.]